jgi:subtilisin family serine protease
MAPPALDAAASAASKLRGDLAALVAGETALDPRLPGLVPGYRAGEIPYFVLLSEPRTAAHRAALEGLGLRILREYRAIDALAVASRPVDVLRAAALPSVAFLAPIEVVVSLDGPEPYVDQTRSTAGDLGAPGQWNRGITGKNVRIAILDTGIDPTHPDLDDQDFRRWSALLPGSKIVDQRNFVGGQCVPLVGVLDLHGHGTHVAGIAAGTGEGMTGDASDNGKHAGIAPDAELAVAKVLTDAGAGINSDLLAAMEWAATPASEAPLGCGIGAQIVNMSLGSEVRPQRQNSGSDVDMISLMLNRLAVRYGTLFVVSAGNSGPFIGSQLEAPGSASQALSVGAAAKDWDLNHDDTYSGDPCAGYQHPSNPPAFADNTCDQGPGTQPSSLSSLSSRGPSGDLWLRPDIAAPGYYIVSAQAAGGAAIIGQDINPNTRLDPLYATASGTSMAAPATAGSAALVLQAYRDAYGAMPSGASGTGGLARAPAFALVRAALMNSARADLLEARLVSKTDLASLNCQAPLEQIPFICDFVDIFQASGMATVYEVRNGPDDPYVGPLGEGAGKVQIAAAIAALRDGVVVYSAASGTGATAGTGPRDLQGSWQVGAIPAGSSVTQRFVAHAAARAGKQKLTVTFDGGSPSDGSEAIPTAGAGAWSVQLPTAFNVSAGGDATFSLSLTVPAGTAPGIYTGAVRMTTSSGQQIHLPVFAVVSMHDPDPAEGNAPGPQAAAIRSDAFAKADTLWPSVVGSTGTGASSDWNVYAVELGSDLTRAVFTAADVDSGTDTYDLYLYDADLDLVASTHPGAMVGVTDQAANQARGPTPASAPQVLTIPTPAGGRHYLVVNRAKVGRVGPQPAGDFGAFSLTLDEVRLGGPPAPTQVTYEGDYVMTAGQPARLAAKLLDAGGAPIAGRTITFTIDDSGSGPCPGGTCSALTDYRGIAQLATDPIGLSAGIHEVKVAFAGDAHWQASSGSALVVVIGSGGPPGPGTARLTGGGWFLREASPDRMHFAVSADGSMTPASGHLGYRDPAEGLDLRLAAYATMTVTDSTVTLTGAVRHADGSTSPFRLVATDYGEPGRGQDTLRFELLDRGYVAEGVLGGGNLQLHR